MAPRLHAPAPDETVALEVWHFGDRPARAILYDDDGVSLSFERDGPAALARVELVVEESGSGDLVGRVERREGTRPLGYDPVTFRFVTRDR
jgi:alpha-D-xyloside xylohydrolase